MQVATGPVISEVRQAGIHIFGFLMIFGIWSIRSCVDDNKLQTAFENGLKPEWSKNITAEQGTVL